MKPIAPYFKGLSSTTLGLMAVVLVVTGFVVSYQKDKLLTSLSPGEEIAAEFSANPGLEPGQTQVKIADVVVGTVSGVEKGHDATSVTLKLDEDVRDVLGRRPRAHVRATTLLGGRHFVDLDPSGDGKAFEGDTIPIKRTTLPVELGDVLKAFPDDAQKGIRSATRQLDRTLKNGGKEAVRDLLRDVPGVSRPAIDVLKGVQGTRPEQDLYELVPFLQATAEEITADEKRVGRIVDDLDTTAAVLARHRTALSDTVEGLDETLVETRAGSDAARTTLVKLRKTASSARPVVQALEPLLTEADTALDEAGPLVRDLRPLLADARPLVDDLVPTARDATRTLGNVRGPVLDRVKGPIKETVTSDWHGSAAYEGNGNDNLLYEEVGYLAGRGAHLSQYGDKNGPLFAKLALGVGISSVGNVDMSLYEYLSWIGTVPGVPTEPIELPGDLSGALNDGEPDRHQGGPQEGEPSAPETKNPSGDAPTDGWSGLLSPLLGGGDK